MSEQQVNRNHDVARRLRSFGERFSVALQETPPINSRLEALGAVTCAYNKLFAAIEEERDVEDIVDVAARLAVVCRRIAEEIEE